MPPKKKLTKEEKEKRKREEAERQAKEDEENRKRQEEEEIARREQERLQAEEQKKQDNEERIRRVAQIKELDEIVAKQTELIQRQESQRRINAKWERYTRCDGSPDPTVPGEINTFIGLLREDTEHIDIDSVFKDGQLLLSLINELNFLLEDWPECDITDKERARYKQTIDQLEWLLQQRLDFASLDLLQKATLLANPETLNLEAVIADETKAFTLCMWGSLSHNPRIKQCEFAQKGLKFDIPRSLMLADCAVRVLFTNYDNYSHHSLSFAPRLKAAPEPQAVELVVEERPVEEKKPEPDPEEAKREDTVDVMTALRDLDSDKEEEVKKELVVVEAPIEEVVDVIIKTPEPQDYDEFEGDENAIDLRAYHTLGGVIHFNLVQMPPQPKTIKQWTMTRLIEPLGLQPIDYQAEQVTAATTAPPVSSSTNVTANKDAKDENQKKDPERPLIGVSLRLPEDVCFSEQPQVAWWDEKKMEWRLDGSSDAVFNEEMMTLSFKISHFGTMALFQDAHINMPFQSWEIRPRGLNHAQLTIIAAIVEVEIQIKNGFCSLSGPENKKELDHLRGKWLAPNTFIQKLKLAGINLFPACDSFKYVQVADKNAITEDRLYQQMGMTASVMAYSWSKWNSEVKDREKIIVQGTVQLEDGPLAEDEWSLLLIMKKRTALLKMTEFSETFSEERATGTEYNSNLYHMAMEMAPDKARERMQESDHTFCNAVATMLRATRLTVFS